MQTVSGAVRPNLTGWPRQGGYRRVSMAASTVGKKNPRVAREITRGVLFLLLMAIGALAIFGQPNNTVASSRFFLMFALYVGIAALGIALRGTDDVLEPFLVVIFLYSAYSWSAIWAVEISREEAFPVGVLLTYYLCIIVGLISFMLAYSYAVGGRRPFHRVTRPLQSSRTFYYLCLATTLVVAVIKRNYLARTFDPRQIEAYSKAATPWRKEALVDPLSGLVGASEMFIVTLLLTCLLLPTFTKRKFGVLGFSLTGVWALLALKSGGKIIPLTLILAALIYRHYYVRPIRLRSIAVLGMLLYFPLTMLNNVRNTTSLTLMASNAAGLVREDPNILSPAKSGELVGPPFTLLKVIEAIDSGQLTYSYGKTDLDELLTFIPRAVYPARPQPLSLQYMASFYPSEMQKGQGFGFFVPTEGYWAFGVVGVCLQMAAYGAILGALYRFFRENLQNGIIVLIYVMVWFPLIVATIRTGLIGSVKGTLMTVGPLLVLYSLQLLFSHGRHSRFSSYAGISSSFRNRQGG